MHNKCVTFSQSPHSDQDSLDRVQYLTNLVAILVQPLGLIIETVPLGRKKIDWVMKIH